MHNIGPPHRPGSDPTPQSIDSSPREEVSDTQDGAGHDEAFTSFHGATSMEVCILFTLHLILFEICFLFLEPDL